MNYVLEPEVPGEFGKQTIKDNSIHPPIVSKVHIIFKGWMGDDIIERFPVFLVTERLAKQILGNDLTGFEIRECIIESSEELEFLQPEVKLPQFLWLKILGKTSDTDFYINNELKLAVSNKAFNILNGFNLKFCNVTEINDSESNKAPKKSTPFWRKFFR